MKGVPIPVVLILGALVLAGILYEVPERLLAGTSELTALEKIDAQTNIRTSILQFVALCGAIITVYYAFRRVRAMERRNQIQDDELRHSRDQMEAQNRQTQQQLALLRQGQLDDRYTRAVELLGKVDANAGTRTGGIYALERIAREEPTYHWQVMEILTAFVVELSKVSREQYPVESDETVQQPFEVGVLMTVIGRRLIGLEPSEIQQREQGKRLDLRLADLRNLDLSDLNLANADLSCANFQKSLLKRTDLRGAKFLVTDFSSAYMRQADLRNTSISGTFDDKTDLQYTRLEGANLTFSGLTQSQLSKAWIDETTVSTGGLSMQPDWWRELVEDSKKQKREFEQLVANGRLRPEDF